MHGLRVKIVINKHRDVRTMKDKGPPPVIHIPTTQFVQRCFREYYTKAEIPMVHDLDRREFGAIIPGRTMRRHMGFNDMPALKRYLTDSCPAHVYHSTAYYEMPGAATMDKKTWLGADLIFDLDADHIPGAEEMSYAEMLAQVKVEFIKLIEEFLMGDFGFAEKDIGIYFSGGRGYHAHVRHPSVRKLNSHERREIVNFITLPAKDISGFLSKKAYDVTEFKGHSKAKYTYILPDPDAKGWKGKFWHSLMEYLDNGLERDRKEIIEELIAHDGIGKGSAETIYSKLFKGDVENTGASNIKRSNSLEAFSSDRVRNLFLDFILERTRAMAGETDEPVTSDIKRLIRLPGSLHGKTGFYVKSLELGQLEEFDPLIDTVWKGFTGNTKITGTADHTFQLIGEEWEIKKDESMLLPTAVALHVALQKKCKIS